MKSPHITIVILNTNRRNDTLEALESIYKGDYPWISVLVLDNNSNDGSVEAIQSQYHNAIVQRLTQNLGYAGNNNVGINAAIAKATDWVLVLNEDTILAPDCISKMVNVANNDTDIGVVGPMVYHYDERDVIQSAGGQITADWQAIHIGQNELDRGQYQLPRTVDWISGCAIMVKCELIQQVGALDERFFYYFEETEWCLRARKAGWKIVHVPDAKIWHKGVQRNYTPGPNVTYYATRNRLLLLSKHHAPVWVRLKAWAVSIKTLISWSVRPKWMERRQHRDALLQGMIDFIYKRWGMRPTLHSTVQK